MAQAMQESEIRELVQLLEHQRVLFSRLRVLADRQKALVVQDDPQPLLELLSERQRLVDGLVGLNGRLGPYRTRWTAIYSGLDEPDRRMIAELLEESNTALSSILQSDTNDTQTLQARRHDMVNRMDALENQSRAATAYSAAGRASRHSYTDARA